MFLTRKSGKNREERERERKMREEEGKSEEEEWEEEEEIDYDMIDNVPVPKDMKERSTEERKDVAIQLYENGVKWNDITKTTGLNPKMIKKAIDQAGILKRTKKGKRGEERGKSEEEQPKEKKESKEKEKTKTVVRGTVAPIKVLDTAYADALGFYGEKLSWFGQAVTEIGQVAMLMLFQIAKISPDDAYLKLEEFKDADEFISYATKYLVALFQAKDEAVKIVSIEEERDKLRMKLYMALQAIENVKNQRNEYFVKARMAMSCLDEQGLRKFAFATTFSETETQRLEEGKG